MGALPIYDALEQIGRWFGDFSARNIELGAEEARERIRRHIAGEARGERMQPLPDIWKSEEAFRLNLELKCEHTLRVVENAREIAASVAADARFFAGGDARHEIAVAQIIAYLHDAGRFYQLRRNGTFSDLAGENHAALGIQAIRDEKLGGLFSESDESVIATAVAQHNAYRVGAPAGSRAMMHAKIIRDADKLDIFGIMTDTGATRKYSLYNDDSAGAFTDRLLESAIGHANLRYEDIKTLEDWAVFNVSLIYDVNYPKSFERIKRNGYVEKILAPHLGQHPLIPELIRSANAYIDSRLAPGWSGGAQEGRGHSARA
jgi:hypothetical protein